MSQDKGFSASFLLSNKWIRSSALVVTLVIGVTFLSLVASDGVAWAQASNPATKYNFTSFYPGGCENCGIYATAGGVDNKGDVVGSSLVSKIYNGYERSVSGTFTSFYDSSGYATLATGIDSAGTTIVGGVCVKAPGERSRRIRGGGGGCNAGLEFAGFLYQNGVFTQYQFSNLPTYINGVNDNGKFVGYYVQNKILTGFISNGKTISYNGADTSLNSINDKGTIVGSSGTIAF